MHKGAQRTESSPLLCAGGDGPGSGGFCSMTFPTLDHCSSSPRSLALGFQITFAQATPPPGTPSSHSLLRPHLSSWPPDPLPSRLAPQLTRLFPRHTQSQMPMCTHGGLGAALSQSAPSPTFRRSQHAGPWVSSQHPAQGPRSGKEQEGPPTPPPPPPPHF